MASEQKTYAISKYLAAVKRLVSEQIPTIWVHGVITQLQERGRMVYLAIAEYAEGDVKPVATLSLFIYGSEYTAMLRKLEALPAPFRLQTELKVNLLVQADFYVPQGKFQGRVLDIDPVYTLGELALTRQAILQRLVAEGLRYRNASMPLATVPLKVGLITGEGTAAYHDFMTTLSSGGFAFSVHPEWARMQGSETETTVLEALGKLRAVADLDVVCVVRGGGSRTDLNYFDSEALCRAVALFPIPVLTGIGHEIDQSLLDLVAYRSCITPTDCAKFLVSTVLDSWQNTRDLGREVARKVERRLREASVRLQNSAHRLGRSLPQRFAREAEKHRRFREELAKAPLRRIAQERLGLARNSDGLQQGARKILEYQRLRLELLQERISARDPARLMRQGYSLTVDTQGRLVRSVQALSVGTVLVTRLADGEITSQVQSLSGK